MVKVLFLGKSDRRIEQWARAHAKLLENEGGSVLFLALYGQSYKDGNFEFVNCTETVCEATAQEIQREVPVSVNRALACDRSITDYTYSLPYGSYSNLSIDQIETLVLAIGNVLLKRIDEIDYCVDGLFDNFITPLAFHIAWRRQIPFYMVRLWQYWDTRFHVVDSPGYTSSVVERLYPRYYRRLSGAAYDRVRSEFLAARFSPGTFKQENWKLRARVVRDKFRSYERPSLWNWMRRRVARIAGTLRARSLRIVPEGERPSHYILFALHVAPEASILGTDAEIADQFSLIRRMSINVPFGVQILCKAHPGDKFGRDIDFGLLQRLCALYNVSLVPESERIGSFLSDPRCLAIATINGSVALDSVIEDKPCFLFGKGIFASATCFIRPRDDDEFFEQMLLLCRNQYRVDRKAVAAIILSLKRATFDGRQSFRDPGTWLEHYCALLPAIHEAHAKLSRRQKPE